MYSVDNNAAVDVKMYLQLPARGGEGGATLFKV